MADHNAICGANAVAALFRRRPDDVLRLFYAERARDVAGPLCAVLARARRPYRMVPEEDLARVAGTGHHGGLVAVARPRHVPILAREAPPRGHDLLLLLDGIGNPHNLGAIARSAAFFGAGAIVLREGPGVAMPSDAAYRVAEGGLEHVDLFRTRDLPAALRALDPYYRTVAATLAPDAVPLSALPRDRALALVLGNEEAGIAPEVAAACRRQVRIVGRGAGAVQSLNVAQAAAVLLHALSTGLAG